MLDGCENVLLVLGEQQERGEIEGHVEALFLRSPKLALWIPQPLPAPVSQLLQTLLQALAQQFHQLPQGQVKVNPADLPQCNGTRFDSFAGAGENDAPEVVKAGLAVYSVTIPVDSLEELAQSDMAMHKLVP